MSTLDDFRASLAARNDLAVRARGHRDRYSRLAGDVVLAEQENAEAGDEYEAALASRECGEAADVGATREHRDLAVARLDELRSMTTGLHARVAAADAALDVARRTAAGMQTALCIELAAARESALRATAESFAVAWRAWLRVAKSASAAAYAASGVRGDPVPVDGPSNLLIRAGGLTDDGLRGLMARHGVAAGTLQIANMVSDVLTESELLAVADEAIGDEHRCTAHGAQEHASVGPRDHALGGGTKA